MNVTDLIEQAGGPVVISDASRKTRKYVQRRVVLDWKRNGIPEWHLPLMSRLTGVSIEELREISDALRRKRKRVLRPLASRVAA